MRECFVRHKFSAASMHLIELLNGILDEYEDAGYDLTLRQLYYQCIARDVMPDSWIDAEYNRKNGLEPDTKNTDKNYKRLGELLSNARLAGLVDWDMIKDRGRELVENAHWDSVAGIVNACAEQFRYGLWEEQDHHVEVWVEKQALEGVLIPVCQELDMPFIANKGYSSNSAMYEAGKRLQKIVHNGKQPVVLYLGDHDPSGIDMTRDIEDRLRIFSDGEKIIVERLALNLEQVRKLKPPRNPAKLTDSRATGYVSRFGYDCWELDALEPKLLAKLVRDAAKKYQNAKAWKAALKRQEEARDKLREIAEEHRE